MFSFRAVALLLLAMPLFCQAAQASGSCVDVALVLSLDSSGSISDEEFALQTRGIAAALRDGEVLETLETAGVVAMSAVVWGSTGIPKQRTRWTFIQGPRDAETFARLLESLPRQANGDTGLGAGLQTSLQMFDKLGVCAIRKIINLSGDGRETANTRTRLKGWLAPPQVRDLAASRRVEINALAISRDEPDLPDYYAHNVITGPDAFVMEIRQYTDFSIAIRRKLIREISPRRSSIYTTEARHRPFPVY